MRLALALTIGAGLAACGSKSPAPMFRPATPCEVAHPPRPGEPGAPEGYPGGGEEHRVTLDVDGDLRQDRLLTSAGDCDRFGNCAYRVYVMRGGCGHAVAVLWARTIRPIATGATALVDLIATTGDRQGQFEEWYRWTGDRYRCVALRERSGLTRGGGRDPHASWGRWQSCE